MIDYEKEQEFRIERIRFWYQHISYMGRGFMLWNPKDGFRIHVVLDRKGGPAQEATSSGLIRIADQRDTILFRIRLQDGGYGIVPNVFLQDKESELNSGFLSYETDQVIFINKYPVQANWNGSALFSTLGQFGFPDSVEEEISINKRPILSRRKGGLLQDDATGIWVSGHHIRDAVFELQWSLPKSLWTRTECWRWGRASQRALSIIFGQKVQLLRQEVMLGQKSRKEIRKEERAEKISSSLSPITRLDSREGRLFTKETFLKLTEFFAKNRKHSDVCWQIFCQIAEASRQESWQARELLLATILEAALRTIDNKPFRQGDWSWKIEESMCRFRESFLSADWAPACHDALTSWEHLRHRNAHPDWLTSEDERLSKEKMRPAITDMMFLSRFYGYIILALAGFRNIKPKFPKLSFENAPDRGNESAEEMRPSPYLTH